MSQKQPFISKTTARDAYEDSLRWMRPYFEPLDEFERLARNKPSSRIDAHLPKVTDGTLATINQETPKRIIQQTPSGLVTCKDYPEFAKLADLELSDYLIPSYNRMGDMLQKSWTMVSKAMTYGMSTSYTFYTRTNGKLHTDFIIPYVKDVLPEKGKVFAPDSNVAFMRGWYTKRDLLAIISREQSYAKEMKGYTSEWDLKELQSFIDAGATTKSSEYQTPAERDKGLDNGAYEIIHAFQKGVGAEFYSLASQSGKVLRSKANPDPRGLIPLDFMYYNIDLSNPLGRGMIEPSAGVQNLIDQQMQMYQFMSTLQMGPPLQVWGTVNRSTLKFRPNAIWDMGRNANPNQNIVTPYNVNNSALSNFTSNMQFLQSKLYNLNSSNDTSIGADSGNINQSKTQAGVKAQEGRLGVSDNYLRKQYEAWFEAQSETSLNLYFAEMKGTKKVELSPEDVAAIQKTDSKKYLKGTTLTIPYKDINKVSFAFEVDPGTSQVKTAGDNAEKLTEVYGLMSRDPDPEVQKNKSKVLRLLINEIGAEGTDDLFEEDQQTEKTEQPSLPSPEELVQLVQQIVEQSMQSNQLHSPQIADRLGIKFSDLPEDAKQQVLQQLGIQSSQPTPQFIKQQTDTVLAADKQARDNEVAISNMQPSVEPFRALEGDDLELAKELLERGFGDDDIEQAVIMQRGGMTLEDIVKTLARKQYV